MLLEGKNCIIYGGGGSIGAGVARTFAREGARLFLVGRTREPLEAVVASWTAPRRSTCSTRSTPPRSTSTSVA